MPGCCGLSPIMLTFRTIAVFLGNAVDDQQSASPRRRLPTATI